MKNMVLSLVMAMGLGACSTMSDLDGSQGGGVKRRYVATYDQTWDATIETLNKLELPIESQKKDEQEGRILAHRGMTAFSWGENVAIFVKPLKPDLTEVEVVSKKVVTVNVTAPDWTQDILSGIQNELSQSE